MASDHSPIILSTAISPRKKKRRFSFEYMWLRELECTNIVEETWKRSYSGSEAFHLVSKLKHLAHDLSKWIKAHCGSVGKRIREMEQDLASLQKERTLRAGLSDLLHNEQVLWAQRAHQLWLVNGDKNTRYFHALVSHIRSRNRITHIKDSQGNWIEDYQTIKYHAVSYFSTLYSNQTLSSDEPDFDDILFQANIPKLSKQHIQELIKSLLKIEIENGVFQLKGDKVPG